MTRKEFLALVNEAASGTTGDMTPFHGCALHKERIMATREQCISDIRYQALQLNGKWDDDELIRLSIIFKRVDMIDSPSS
jgi:hypothetical protein